MYPADSRSGDVLPMFEGVVTRVCTEESHEQTFPLGSYSFFQTLNMFLHFMEGRNWCL